MEITVYSGGEHIDNRGMVRFFNDFSLEEIVRFYEIYPISGQPRGWQAHKAERKWFYCKSGTIIVNLVKLDNFDQPSPRLELQEFELNADKPKILAVPCGYASAFLAREPGASLMVYSNFPLEASQKDDYRFPLETWKTSWG